MAIKKYPLRIPNNADSKMSAEIKKLSKEEFHKLSFGIRKVVVNDAKEKASEYINKVHQHLLTVPKILQKEALLDEYNIVYAEFKRINAKVNTWYRFYRHVDDEIYSEYLRCNLTPSCIFRSNFFYDFRNYFQNEIERKELTKAIDSLTHPEAQSASTKIVHEYTDHVQYQENPNPRIFKSAIHFKLFEIYRQQIQEKNQLAEFSFIYWSMRNDGFILEGCRPAEFRSWVNQRYSPVYLSEIKTLDRCRGRNKASVYNMAKQVLSLNTK